MINLNKIEIFKTKDRKSLQLLKSYTCTSFFFSFKKTQDDSQQLLVAQIDVFDLKVG